MFNSSTSARINGMKNIIKIFLLLSHNYMSYFFPSPQSNVV